MKAITSFSLLRAKIAVLCSLACIFTICTTQAAARNRITATNQTNTEIGISSVDIKLESAVRKLAHTLSQISDAGGHNTEQLEARSIEIANEVQQLVSQGARIRPNDYYGRTVLFVAAWCGREEVVTCLLDAGLPVDIHNTSQDVYPKSHTSIRTPQLCSRDTRGISALHIAAERGHLGVVKTLVNRGADINKVSRDQFSHMPRPANIRKPPTTTSTPLSRAVLGENYEIASYLCKHGADANIALDDTGNTILHLVALGGNVNGMKTLVQCPGNLSSTTKRGQECHSSRSYIMGGATPLDCARAANNRDMIALLESVQAPTAQQVTQQRREDELQKHKQQAEKQLQRYMQKFRSSNMSQKMKLELMTRELTTEYSRNRSNALVSEMTQLVAQGTRLDPTNHSGYVCLYDAALSNNVELVKLLLDAGVDVDVNGNNASSNPRANRYGEKVRQPKIFTQRRHELSQIRNGNGITALHIAAVKGHRDIVELLVQRGANVNALCGGSPRSTPISRAIRHGHYKVAQHLYTCGADVNVALDGIGFTLVHMTAERGKVEAMETLVQCGADVTQRTTKERHWSCDPERIPAGSTPLHVARIYQNHNVIDFLASLQFEETSRRKGEHDAQTIQHLQQELNSKRERLVHLVDIMDAPVPLRPTTTTPTRQINPTLQEPRPSKTNMSAAQQVTQAPTIQFPVMSLHATNASTRDDLLLSDQRAGFHQVIQERNLPTVRSIIQALEPKIAMNLITSSAADGVCALHMAAKTDDARIMRLLLAKSGSNCNQQTEHGATPLHTAVWHAALNTTEVLLQKGADANCTLTSGRLVVAGKELDVTGWTPLHLAVAQGDLEFVSVLLAHGASTLEKDHSGNTPHDIAVFCENEEIIECLAHQEAPPAYDA